MSDQVKFLTTFEAADILGISPSTVLRMCNNGEIKAIRPRNNYRIPDVEVERLLEPLADDEVTA